MASSGIQHDFLDPPKDSGDYLGTLGHYRVVKELGKGGMGYVFLAEDTRLKRDVALKVMNQKIAATPGSKKRFISEARAMAAVHHDNVATIFEVGERNGTPFMAMELLEGATLENYRERNGEPDYQTIIAYARDIARGLAAAHAQGIVHRDIKPANIWLDTKTNRIKILDFGLALASTPVDQLSGRGAVVGTPGYLSPEQARSEPLDDRCDLYSAGVVLYELATGSLPLKTKSVAEQLIAILANHPKPIRERNEKIPQPLADMIHRLMAKEPRDRYRSAAELATALDEVEVECEKKSEVAQAISQLQLGLEKAVSKSQGGKSVGGDEMLEAGVIEQAPPNPFEALPDVLPAAAPIAAAMATSGVHAAVPVAAKGKPAKAASSSSNSKVLYLAVGGVAALLLILIPVIVYLSDSSALARQQNQPLVVGANPNPQPSAANRQNNANPNPSRQTPQQPQPQQPTRSPQPSSQSKPPQPAATLVTKVNAVEVKGAPPQGSKWIMSNKQGNGSFEQGEPKQGDLKIQGWTATKVGADVGWDRLEKPPTPEARTFAYAGAKSELVLTSDNLKHQTKAGDSFRISATIGGEGNGKTNYKIVLGFRGQNGPPTLYQIAELDHAGKWVGAQQRRLNYEYSVDKAVAGKQPFLQVTVSNKNSNRARGMVDRLVVTVNSNQIAAAKPNQPAAPKPNATKTPAPSTLASTTPKTTSPSQPTPTVSTPPTKPSAKPSAKPTGPPAKPTEPKAVRAVSLTTATEGGADTTVKRGASLQDTQGDKPTLAIQTRNNRQIQHIYLRFPLVSLRAELGGANNNQPRGNQRGGQNSTELPVVSADLVLNLAGAAPTKAATIRVYGLNDTVSDVWPESRLAWANSLSVKGLQSVPLLAEATVKPADEKVTFSNSVLADFVAKSPGRSVTLILTGSEGNELVTFAAKEEPGKAPPTLVLGLSE